MSIPAGVEDTTTELELITGLDFDPDWGCTAAIACVARAVFIGWFTCCGVNSLFCGAHKAKREKDYAASMAEDWDARCARCKQPLRPDSLQFRLIGA